MKIRKHREGSYQDIAVVTRWWDFTGSEPIEGRIHCSNFGHDEKLLFTRVGSRCRYTDRHSFDYPMCKSPRLVGNHWLCRNMIEGRPKYSRVRSVVWSLWCDRLDKIGVI